MDVELCVRILYDSHKYKKRVKCCDVNHKIYFYDLLWKWMPLIIFPFFNCMKDTQCHGFIYYHSTSRHKHKTLTFWFFKTGGVGCVYYSLCEKIISQIRWKTKIFFLFCVRCFTSFLQIKKKENKNFLSCNLYWARLEYEYQTCLYDCTNT